MGLEVEAAYTLMTMTLFWNSGEHTLQGPGIPPLQPPGTQEYEDVSETVSLIAAGTLSGIDYLYDAARGLKGWRPGTDG